MRGALMVALAVLAPFRMAYAEAWDVTFAVNESKSVTTCAKTVVLKLDFSNNMLSATNQNGKLFTMPVSGDGDVKGPFKSSNGNSFEFSGNVKARKFELTNSNAGCSWNAS
jgi:hypothetical protein